jgi:hypothetical protein
MATKEEILNTFTSKEGAWFAYREGMQIGYNEAFNSIRNQAAIAAMQGMLSNPNSCLAEGDTYPKIAVAYADKLIKQLKEK